MDLTYHSSQIDTELQNFTLAGLNLTAQFDDLEMHRLYTTLTYGLLDRWEAYVKLGGVYIEQDDLGYSSGNLTYGWGTRVTILQGDRVDWGAGLLMSWIEADDSYRFNGNRATLDFDAYELQVAVGPTLKFSDWLRLYGGLLYYSLRGDFDATVTGTLPGSPFFASGDIEEDSNLGAYVGGMLRLAGLDFTVETAILSDAWGVGGHIGWRF